MRVSDARVSDAEDGLDTVFERLDGLDERVAELVDGQPVPPE